LEKCLILYYRFKKQYQPKTKDMSKSSRNSGKLKQDAIISQFARDARSSNENCAVMQCMRKSPRESKPEAPRMSFRFLSTGQ